MKPNKRVTDAHVQKENDGNGRLRGALLDARLRVGGREQNAFRVLLRAARGVCFLVWPRLKVTEEGSGASDARSPPGCSLCYNRIWWKGENVRSAAAPNRPAVSEGVNVSDWGKERLPLSIHPSVHPSSLIRTDSSKPSPPRLGPPPWSPSSFQHDGGFKKGLHSPGHLGWWSPQLQGSGTSLERRLEGNA